MPAFRCSALLSLSLFAIGHAVAQSSKEYAVMGRATWAAFECSSLAAKLNNGKEQERLFLYGYKQGKIFVEAARVDKIERSDMNTEVPVGFLLLLEGPTTDFILGRAFESAQDGALKEVFGPPGQMNSSELQSMIAGNKFTKSNCSLVGTR